MNETGSCTVDHLYTELVSEGKERTGESENRASVIFTVSPNRLYSFYQNQTSCSLVPDLSFYVQWFIKVCLAHLWVLPPEVGKHFAFGKVVIGCLVQEIIGNGEEKWSRW